MASRGTGGCVADDTAGVEFLRLDDVARITLEDNRDIRKALELRNTMEGKYVEERAAALPQLVGTARGTRSWDTTQEAFGIPRETPRWALSSG